LRLRFPNFGRLEQLDGQREGACISGLQRPDADDLARDLFASLVADGEHH
jgi:hypothetical protein